MLGMVAPYRAAATRLFIAMDSLGQHDHLRAYGIAYTALQKGIAVDWLLNYKCGSFAMHYSKEMEKLCMARGVTYSKIADDAYLTITARVKAPDYNGDVIKLTKAPRIAVYTPLNKEPWDDAVTLALTYAGIPFDKVYANEVLAGALDRYDWLHIFHEDFSGQFGKFWFGFRNSDWYLHDVRTEDSIARLHGYKKVSQLELAVVMKIRDFIGKGGNMFAMCSATETFDIALAAAGIDICKTPYDGDPADTDAQRRLDYSKCLAFTNFKLSFDSITYPHSDIDNNTARMIPENTDFFYINSFNAKVNPIPALLCQNHTQTIKGFWGQTTAFRNAVLKPETLVLAECKALNEAKYLHGEWGSGTWTFYGGHDPEDYRHTVGAKPTDLMLHAHSPGYRLILNNVLFNAAKSKNSAVVAVKEAAPVAAPAEDENLVISRIELDPDPENGELLIKVPETAASATAFRIHAVAVLDPTGKEVLSKSCNDLKVSLNIADLAAGVYIIKINSVYAGRIVKE